MINLGINITEAINYGCNEWVGDYEPHVCKCDENGKNDIAQDRTIVTARRRMKKTLYQCKEQGCQNLFTNLKKLEEHKKILHRKQNAFTYKECSKVFAHANNLRKHEKIHTREESQKQCKECGKWVADLQQHSVRNH